MKAALKTLAIVWSCISVVSLAGLLYLLPSYGIVGAFAGVFRATPQSDELARWFHICEIEPRARDAYDRLALANPSVALREGQK